MVKNLMPRKAIILPLFVLLSTLVLLELLAAFDIPVEILTESDAVSVVSFSVVVSTHLVVPLGVVENVVAVVVKLKNCCTILEKKKVKNHLLI